MGETFGERLQELRGKVGLSRSAAPPKEQDGATPEETPASKRRKKR